MQILLAMAALVTYRHALAQKARDKTATPIFVKCGAMRISLVPMTTAHVLLHVPFTLELVMTHTQLHQLSFVIETVCLSEINDQTHLQLPGSHQIYQHAEFKAVSLRYL